MNAQKTYHIWTIGCQMNEADSRRLAQQLEFVGYEPNAQAEAADVVVLNTCVVRQQAEDKVVSRLGALKAVKQARPDLTVALMGCMVGMREAPVLKQRFPFVDVFMPPSETAPLLDYLQAHGLFEEVRETERRDRALRDAVQDEDLPLPVHERGSVLANVPIVLGCSHACTFCVIPYRRGAERSRPVADILTEIRSLVEQGVREVMLLGQIVDRYGTDMHDGTDLSLLLRRVAEIDGLRRVRFLTSHPNYMTDAILETVASTPKICPQIEVPIQAGNDTVLENMRRGYTAQHYRDLVARIRSFMPDAAIHTDLIVGFPGETHEQYMDTYRIVEELQMDKVHLSKYSVRPKTIAARRMPDDVSEEEKQERWQRIEDLQTGILEKKNNALRGATVSVLVEDLYKGRWRGRTPHGKLVFFEDLNDRRGEEVKVTLNWTGPYSMIGKPEGSASRTLPVITV
ncbi:MAG: tRNA (N6-isopentenyl adenosine(37)-C2)-methylthiotransferase MiaB [Kiritimatiellae bacterium]|nr:tRNA (N6-isopentenyl adenosine(37)-C2)-methylthiotransferase MiaB [Kiritimatiellia bacterium]MCO5045603.1 tRNA (N6-isopentenyl adenosine(37)-C2)-methylthiotransferase MiaB [Kiritimatiellia bacterium]MCO6399739.1 tRNA (N6-isopentenyl adenosine(37)-C2)-methylthiotransferase MiaB [Verrucomicrobiota bacterium]